MVALGDIVIPKAHKPQQSHSILFSRTCAVGAPLGVQAVRSIMEVHINNFADAKFGNAYGVFETPRRF